MCPDHSVTAMNSGARRQDGRFAKRRHNGETRPRMPEAGSRYPEPASRVLSRKFVTEKRRISQPYFGAVLARCSTSLRAASRLTALSPFFDGSPSIAEIFHEPPTQDTSRSGQNFRVSPNEKHRSAPDDRESGFSIISAIFLLVVLSALGAFIVNISSGQHISAAADVQGARAYQAARAGIEWGAYQVLDPNGSSVVAALPACPAATTFTPFAGFSTTVTCSASTHTENGNNIGVYRFGSAASSGTAGNVNYVERVIDVTVAKCKDPAAAAPFSCG